MPAPGTIDDRPWDAEPKLLEQIGARVRLIRKTKKKTAADLAKKTGLPRSHISAIELGKLNPTVQTLDRIARGMDVSIRELMPLD